MLPYSDACRVLVKVSFVFHVNLGSLKNKFLGIDKTDSNQKVLNLVMLQQRPVCQFREFLK